jgi:hypothetical protein
MPIIISSDEDVNMLWVLANVGMRQGQISQMRELLKRIPIPIFQRVDEKIDHHGSDSSYFTIHFNNINLARRPKRFAIFRVIHVRCAPSSNSE